MSSLSNLPYGKILDYWYERLDGHKHRRKFILTKLIEVFTFKSQSGKARESGNFIEFPEPIYNKVPEHPVIVVVAPVYVRNKQEATNIRNLTESLNKQTYKPESIILVDDCSPHSFDANGCRVHRLSKNFGPAKARNIGKDIALELGADIVAFIDSDCIADTDWLKTISEGFIENRKCNILSGNTISFDEHWFGTYHNINGTLNGRKLKNSDLLLYGTTANLAVAAEVAKGLNFNEQFPFAAGEDIEFCFRANTAGYSIAYIKAMMVMHNYGYNENALANFKKFRNLFKKYGAGERILLEQVPNYYAYFNQTIEISVIQ
ncbi:MAG: glycosyltransferase [Bacteroidetes bacterium]|nr:glycosyltransferase [Bacteroidota bacterium]